MQLQRPRGRSDLPTAIILLLLTAPAAHAQLTDLSLTPNRAGAGIAKSLAKQIGAGRGDLTTPGSSRYIIARDPFRAIRRGRQIFQRKFNVMTGLGPMTHDGAGDIEADASHGAGLADSCAACHGRPRGAAGFGGDVFTRPDSRDAPHLFGLGLQEMLADEITQELRAIRAAAIATSAQRGAAVTVALVGKGIHYGSLTVLPNGSVETAGVQGVDPDLRVRPFFAQGGSYSIREFVVGAFDAEMGLEAADPDLIVASAGGEVLTPSGMFLDGFYDGIGAPPATSPTDDPDLDGVANEVDPALVDYLEFYLLNYFKPGTGRRTQATSEGGETFAAIGCTTCHVPDLLIEHDRRVADVTTAFDAESGIFNRLFATASGRFEVVDDGSGHLPLKRPSGLPFLVQGIYTDFKRHDLGRAFHEVNFDGTVTTLFMTEPLWGVGSTAPYGHDGRSINLEEVILRHGGEAQASRDAFAALPERKQEQVTSFLSSLVLFPPDDTASNLDPGDPSAPGFPQWSHGSIRLTALFNDPSDIE